jgi:hypothetical protein
MIAFEGWSVRYTCVLSTAAKSTVITKEQLHYRPTAVYVKPAKEAKDYPCAVAVSTSGVKVSGTDYPAPANVVVQITPEGEIAAHIIGGDFDGDTLGSQDIMYIEAIHMFVTIDILEYPEKLPESDWVIQARCVGENPTQKLFIFEMSGGSDLAGGANGAGVGYAETVMPFSSVSAQFRATLFETLTQSEFPQSSLGTSWPTSIRLGNFVVYHTCDLLLDADRTELAEKYEKFVQGGLSIVALAGREAGPLIGTIVDAVEQKRIGDLDLPMTVIAIEI